MPQKWIVTRTTSPSINGQQRWDTVYQLLIRWQSFEENPEVKSSFCEGDKNECSLICSCINDSSTERTND